jgi:fluoride exporter
MKEMLLVGLGGFIGSVSRYKLSGLLLHHTLDWRFPLGTFIVNLLGCFVIGALAGWAEKHQLLTANVRLFLLPGVLGGFTTFSAFGFETFALMRRGESQMAVLYVALSVILGLLLVWLGFKLMSTEIAV